jgi:hypothetical protein
MALYKPPTKVGQREISYAAIVARLDPENGRRHIWDEEYSGWYDGSRGRTFWGNPTTRGPYED